MDQSSFGRRGLRKMDLKLQKGYCLAKREGDFSQGKKNVTGERTEELYVCFRTEGDTACYQQRPG